MRCEACKGRGLKFQSFNETVIIDGAWVSLPVLVPCPDCGGCGLAYCCEGERPGNVPQTVIGDKPQSRNTDPSNSRGGRAEGREG